MAIITVIYSAPRLKILRGENTLISNKFWLKKPQQKLSIWYNFAYFFRNLD